MNTARLHRTFIAIALSAGIFASGVPLASAQSAAGMQGVTAGSSTSAPAAQANPQSEPDAYTPPTAAQLNQLLAPVAVFPDNLVAQVLAASSYPEQVESANTWLAQHGALKGAALQDALDQQSWDPGVKAIVNFPDVLHQMAGNLEWTTALGEAYVNDPTDVMNAVQALRQKALTAGNLKSNKYLNVTTQPREAAPLPNSAPADDGEPPVYEGEPVVAPPDQVVEIAPADPDDVYVPYYDPGVFYGAPIAPWPGYAYAWPAPLYFGPAFGAFAFGAGISIDIGFGRPWGWGAWGARWGHGYYGHGWHGPTVVHNNRPYFNHSDRIVNHFGSRASFAAGRGAGFGRPSVTGERATPSMGRSGFASEGGRAGMTGERAPAFGARPAPVNFERMSVPHFDSGMATRGGAPAARGMAETRSSFANTTAPSRAPSGLPQARNGALASRRYAPAMRPGMTGRADQARTLVPTGRGSYGGYAGAPRQYAPAYRTQGAPLNRYGPMPAPRYSTRSFQNSGAYGGHSGGAQRAFSPPGEGGGGHGGGRGGNGHR